MLDVETILAHVVAPPEWMRDALCREYPNVEFFIDRGESSAPAKAICERCIVREECLAYALDEPMLHGIWGGLSARERRSGQRSLGPAQSSPVAVELMVSLRAEGRSLGNICKELTAQGLRPSRADQWSPGTVQTIVQREQAGQQV